jgi:hypothetical protein
MTNSPGADDAPQGISLEEIDPSLKDPEAMKWFGEHLT